MTPSAPSSARPFLPPDDGLRSTLHNEVHARPQARIRMPALVLYVAVFNEGVSREQECAHLRLLPGQQDLTTEQMQGNFLRLRVEPCTLKWERHSEFTRYSLVQPLPEQALAGMGDAELLASVLLPAGWLGGIPGRTVAAIQLLLLHGDLRDPATCLAQAKPWFGTQPLMASVLGASAHSWALTDFMLRPSGFERIVVIAPLDTSQTRAGRVSQRLLELETYRLMALRGLPVAKELSPMLAQAEGELADITSRLENKSADDQELLDTLVSLSARVERATATHMYRFSATRAYEALVTQRIAELREATIPGIQTLGEFLQRRMSPAMATVAATAQRLGSLSERVARASALLRTRVDIAAELQNQQLLAKLTRGQELQLHLQTTVEGLSIAAISYYVVSLLLYAGKALKAVGVPLNPEMAVGALIPLVLWGVWAASRRIHHSAMHMVRPE
ncbi:DUF3422 domain-containing protein [Rhodoferax lacus]|uniref:DUF3422 domain-containing protein n=1 Tax=Rhodoferax lacus TaxID=2184758 RepID=A0A3E1RFL4_9BURK|nr:DUF3422 domain-containing protein [Rhodoferax lacus]RFO97370.1 DUF3422 domain-containing protein [Rhodoferax lacus]